jgi:hypothetical protein
MDPMWDKPKFNFVIDILMFMCLTAIAGLGFLMKYILIPGEERWAVYGRNVDLLFLGMNRHQWGDIHLYLGFTLLALLTLHIILHWNLIPGLYARLIPDEQVRTIGVWALVIVCLAFLFFSFAITPQVQEIKPGEGRVHYLEESGLEVRGSMTLQEVSRQYNVPTGVLKEKLNLPASVPDNERLGRLRRAYGFKMSEIERIILEYQKSHQ